LRILQRNRFALTVDSVDRKIYYLFNTINNNCFRFYYRVAETILIIDTNSKRA